MSENGIITNQKGSQKLLVNVGDLAKEGKWDSVLDPMFLPDAFPFQVQVYCSNWKWQILCDKLGSEGALVEMLNEILSEAADPDLNYQRRDEFGVERRILYQPLKCRDNDVYAVLVVYLGVTARKSEAEIIIL